MTTSKSGPTNAADSELSKRFVALQEFAEVARENLNDHAWGYIIGGADTETTLRRNRQSLDSLALRPRVLNDVSDVDTTSTILGIKTRLPVFLCPIGGLESFDPQGALAVAIAARQFGVPMMLSSVSKWGPDALLQEVPEGLSLIFQLYAREDAAGIDTIVEQASKLNLPAFCITVDSAVYSRRERDILSRYVKPWRASGVGDAAHYQAALNWRDIERIRKNYHNPIILKGIATAEDAQLAIDAGIDVIYVSNHGGRQLDHAEGTTDVLVEVLDTVKDQAKVFVDGGYCRGTDLVKAMALGVDGIGIGRMMCLALAAAGPAGIIRMLELLEIEYRIALALAGVSSAATLDHSMVKKVTPLVTTGNHDSGSALGSAFPLLDP